MQKVYLTLLPVFFFINLHSQEQMVIRISDPAPGDYKYFLAEGYDIAAYLPNIFLDLVVDQKGHDALFGLGFSPKITQTETQMKANLKDAKTLTGYRTYSDVLAELQQLQTNYPTICKLYDLGDSRGKQYYSGGNTSYINYNHDIWALKVSDNVAAEEDEPAIFYFGAHHAREPISTEVTMYILNHIVSNYGSDPDITASVNNKQIWFVPIVNPDGHRAVIEEVYTMWRKNIRDNNGSGTPEIYNSAPDGVDPNRNYGWEWGGQGTSGSFNSDLYRGPSAFSEPETQAMADLMDNHHFVAGISYHSYSELVLHPYGYITNATAPDNAALYDLAYSMAVTIPKLSGSGHYTPQASWQLYAASGVTDDWAYGQHGIFCFTIELATQFIPPASQVPVICQDNLQAAMILLNRVDKSTLTGLVKDASTNQPVVAEVFIDGIDDTGLYREPYLSNADFGRYYRFLLNGNYSVTFSAYGYIPQTFTNVNINSTGQTILNVNLIPAQAVYVSGIVTDLATGLPLQDAVIEIMNTPVLPVNTNALGEYFVSNVMEGTYDFRVSKTDYATIIQSKNVTLSNNVFDFQLEVSTAWSFESGVFEPGWTFSGNAPWYITNVGAYDGQFCARSGAIGNSASSDMSITLNLSSGGDISFYRRVSSEAGFDYLRFYIDGSLQDQWAGEVPWGEVTYLVTAGIHTFRWSYQKDPSVIGGSDCAWIDYIVFPPIIPPPDPPEIALNPMSFEVSLPVDAIQVKQLSIANTGEVGLSFNVSRNYIYSGKASSGTEEVMDEEQLALNLMLYEQALEQRLAAGNLVKPEPNPMVGPTDSFCAPSFTYGCSDGDGLTGFGLEQIQNLSSGCANNTGFTGWSTYFGLGPAVLDAGQQYTVTMRSGYANQRVNIWIDFDDDNLLTEDERVLNNFSISSSNNWYNATITIPENAQPGAHKMRAMAVYSSTFSDPCGSYSWGEAEDYTVLVNSNFVDWLTLDPTSGSVPGSGSSNINLSFNSTSMELGTYYADVTITSNDPVAPSVIIPCTLHIVGEINVGLTAMVEGGFEGSSMTTYLNNAGLLPLTQPFNTAPWNYVGSESVAVIPNSDVADWVLVELRETTGDASTATPATMVSRQAGFVLNDGSIVNIDGSSMLRFDMVANDNLFVIVHHRNHLGIMSANPVIQTAGNYMHDFTTGSGQAHGGINAQKEMSPGVWGMIAGDINADGVINMADKSPEWDVLAGEAGYHQADLNCDGQVNNMDKDDFLIPNQGNSSYIPN
jgi:carboxypeptidase T